jgi:N-acetylneuraminic acid mutarotase
MGDPVEADLAPLLVPRGEHGVAALDGEIYVLGGFTPSVTSTVHAYNPESNAWREVADFPVEFHHPNVAVVDGLLYVLGYHATSAQRVADGSTYAYDPDADEWAPLASQPEGTERGASCVTAFDGKIYVFGGTNGDALTDASYYDPTENQWHVLPDMPLARHHCLAAPYNGKIYLVSGRDVVIEEVQPESFVFDPGAETYDQVAPILTPRGGAAGGTLGELIYVMGGEGDPDDPNGVFHEIEQYDPATDSWSSLPDMTVPRHGYQAAVIGDRMYLPGGSLSQGLDPTTTHTVFYLDAR